MKSILLIVGALAVTGCADTVQARRERGPDLVEFTAKSPGEFRDCIMDKYLVDTAVIERDGVITMARQGEMTLGQFIEASPRDAGGATIKAYGSWGIRSRARECLA